MMAMADVGIVGDAHQVCLAMIRTLKAGKGTGPGRFRIFSKPAMLSRGDPPLNGALSESRPLRPALSMLDRPAMPGEKAAMWAEIDKVWSYQVWVIDGQTVSPGRPMTTSRGKTIHQGRGTIGRPGGLLGVELKAVLHFLPRQCRHRAEAARVAAAVGVEISLAFAAQAADLYVALPHPGRDQLA